MKINAFSKTYPHAAAISFPDIEITPGKVYAIIGANGSGKSTFAKVVSGILCADQKQEILDSAVRIGYMPQRSYPFRLRIKTNLQLSKKDPECAEYLMKALKLDECSSRRANTLSGGETARLALARLLMQEYDLLILDEPTASMDAESTLIAEALIAEYVRKTGCALILITHSLPQARRLADDIWFFHNGQLAESGTAEKMLAEPQDERTRAFLRIFGM